MKETFTTKAIVTFLFLGDHIEIFFSRSY